MVFESFKNLLRTIQVRFPRLQNAKYKLKRILTRRFGKLFEPDFAAIRLFPDRDGRLFLDVGANRGQSIEDLLLVAPASRVVSFEANERLGKLLQEIHRRDARVTVHDFGLGDTEQVLSLYVPTYRSWQFDGLASCRRLDAETALKDRIVGYRDSLATVQEVPCRIRRLDDLHLDPFFIKLDVEGHEYPGAIGWPTDAGDASPNTHGRVAGRRANPLSGATWLWTLCVSKRPFRARQSGHPKHVLPDAR